MVGFVNGLSWVVVELKKPGVPTQATFDENFTHYKLRRRTAVSQPVSAG
ncbi:MAG: hypothetical protein P9F75_09745 [Candidatus Contendobacter sp.]|nr:hypothetical protein [Candidatus Contendobacter sp.]